ncbi:hypothetical protein EDB85DRAFT_1899428 [Lactarius pseudohatsudake]|nr:hypothetical protein EDB85DRAFT_1899428 [Lactarius pseudohatsudake]
MAVANVALPSSLAACVGARYCGGCVVLMREQGAEGQWCGRRRTLQVTIRTAPKATPPRRGDDDGLRQAPSLVLSCLPSPHCCGTWDDDDAAASDPDSAEYYPVGSTSSPPPPSLPLANTLATNLIEYYFNELNEFDRLFARNDQLVYLVYSHLVFHPDYPSFNV